MEEFPVQEHEVPSLAVQAVRDALADAESSYWDFDLKRHLVALAAAAEWLEEEKGRQVAKMRVAGMTWTEIGECLGVSKQAAAKKYGEAPAN